MSFTTKLLFTSCEELIPVLMKFTLSFLFWTYFTDNSNTGFLESASCKYSSAFSGRTDLLIEQKERIHPSVGKGLGFGRRTRAGREQAGTRSWFAALAATAGPRPTTSGACGPSRPRTEAASRLTRRPLSLRLRPSRRPSSTPPMMCPSLCTRTRSSTRPSSGTILLLACHFAGARLPWLILGFRV
jgi:hypothetical protein